VWKAVQRMTGLVREIRHRKFDLLIDFHSFRETNLLAGLSGATNRIAMKRHQAAYWGFCFNQPPVAEDKSLHVAAMFERVVAGITRANTSPAVAAIYDRTHRPLLSIPNTVRDMERLVLFVDAPVRDRIWPPERFASVADFAVERLGARVVAVSSSTGAELAQRVRKATRYPEHVSIETDLTLPQLAAIIASARLLVSNDTGPMHIGPAVGVTTLGLFSVGFPEHFRPIGPNDRYLRRMPIERIKTEEVIANVEQMWTTVDPGPQR
jgi:heptosyltransferase-3